jgi:hypothetical protein
MDRYAVFAMGILAAWSCGSGIGLTDPQFSTLDARLHSLARLASVRSL